MKLKRMDVLCCYDVTYPHLMPNEMLLVELLVKRMDVLCRYVVATCCNPQPRCRIPEGRRTMAEWSVQSMHQGALRPIA